MKLRDDKDRMDNMEDLLQEAFYMRMPARTGVVGRVWTFTDR